jgi:Flp pilus assembly protein CpaB
VTTRRRRGLLLLSVALASGGLAASELHDRERAVAEQVGEPVRVLVAARDIRANARIRRDALTLREVPARYVPPDALASAAGVVGTRAGAAIVAGAYVTPSVLERPQRGGNRLRRGERAVTVEVAGPAGVAGFAPGARVDVLVSAEPGADGGRTTVALAGAELLALAPGGVYGADSGAEDAGTGPSGPSALATLRVTLRQAVYLTQADNFAREIRLLARPARER